MNEILTVIEQEGRQAVDARELHRVLEVGRDFSTWIKDRIEKYGFAEGKDYQTREELSSPVSGSSKARPQTLINYLLSLSMAKEIAIVENNDHGREIRLYLIKVEEAWNTPAAIMARALQVADQELKLCGLRIAQLEMQAEADRPKVEFFDQVADSKDAISMREAAGVLNIPGWGRNKLFEFLRARGILDERNIPYRKYQDSRHFRVIEQKWTDAEGETHISLKTLVYQRGLEYIRNLINQSGVREESA
jgi:anti-repressor protein